jgi:DNA-binding NarL/FixJ family response regulator
MSVIRVVIADDHPQIRAGLRKIISRANDLLLVGEASNGIQTLQLVQQLDPDVLIADIEMPGMTGIEVVQQMRSRGISTPIVIISAYEDREYIIALFTIGISGYLVKEEAPEKLSAAIRAVADRRHKWISKNTAALVSTMLVENRHINKRRLTDFEVCMLKNIQADTFNDEVGFQAELPRRRVLVDE